VFHRPSYLSNVEKKAVLSRFWEKDPSLWAKSPEVQKQITDRLGWLDVIPKMREVKGEIVDFARDIRQRGIKQTVLLGMGGSSLCPLVLSQIFGSQEGFPTLKILDTTDPDEVENVARSGDWDSTLFLMASKSGTTLEPNAMFNYFWPLLKNEVSKPGSHFVAITDPGTPLEKLGNDHGFLKIFLNPADIGGRYSALSYFGLVPAALLGMDIDRILQRAEDMVNKCGPNIPCDINPGYKLGEFLGEFGVQGRDKLTILADLPIKAFGLWLEQLVAESTGKETRGLVPIIGESTGIPGFYGGERIFVYLRIKGLPEKDSSEGFVSELREARFPVYELLLEDLYDLGAQFFLWEMATALASHFLDVNPFDEPDVRRSKEKTREILDVYRAEGKMPVKFWVDPYSQLHFRASEMLAVSMKSLSRAMRDIFHVLPTWGYLAFLPYLPYDPEMEAIIGEMRYFVKQEKGCATTMGYGPRYLHSTGQIYKGGPSSAAFLIFTRKRIKDYPVIPDLDVSFWHIQFAQAVGDFEALSDGRFRSIHLHLPPDYRLGLRDFSKVLSRSVRMK
jgi:glucose-6-phosphate isomerase/transaldolase/glucose-6-phosphate isomerase